MDVFCVRTQIFLIKILNVQRWIICAYEQVSHRDMDVFCVRTQIFLIMILNVQRWIICVYERKPNRDMSVFCVRTQKTSTSLLRICVYAQIIQRWKALLSKNHNKEFLRMNAKNFHVSIKDLHICANNPVLEDCYPKS